MKMNTLLKEFQEEPQSNFLRSSTDQLDFEKEMKVELSFFVEIFDEAFTLTQNDLRDKPLSYQNRNSWASRMNENIRGLLFEKFPENMREANSGRFYFEKPDKCILLFKKLSNSYLPMNIQTENAQNILSQLSFDFPQIPIIFIGYIPDSSWEDLKKICAVYISNRSVVWVSDIRNLERGTPLPLFPSTPSDDTPIIVRPKSRTGEKGQVSSES
jgi:hypothetical protein